MALTRQPARILIIDNLAVESLRREVYRALARTFGCEVHVVAPTAWRETRGVVACEREEGGVIRLHRSRIIFGFRHQRVVYQDLPRIVLGVRPQFIMAVAQPESYAAAQVCLVRRLYAPGAQLGFFCSRNIDYLRTGFPYKLEFTHLLCDSITRGARPDLCFYRPRAGGELFASYAKRLVYAPHMVDCSLFRKAPGQEQTSGDFVIGYAGRLVREKGVHILIDAMRYLPKQARLLLIGEGPEENSLRALIGRDGFADRVEFRAPIPYGEMPGALNSMDALVLPSLDTERWTELFGRILIEAMACELPVVASRSGGIPEVLGDAGVLVEPGDSRALADALARLHGDAAARGELGAKGRERALSQFDVRVVASLLGEEILSSVRASAAEEEYA